MRPFRCGHEIRKLAGLSGHADKEGLIEWIQAFEEKPKKVFVVHGEDSVCTAFAECLKIEYGQRAYAPYSGTEFDLISNKFTYEAAPVAVKKKTKPVTGVFETAVGLCKTSAGTGYARARVS